MLNKEIKKIVFVHDRLITKWWAEKVFFWIINDIINNKWYYTQLVSKYNINNPEIKIFTTFLNPYFKLNTKIDIEAVISTKNIDKFSRQLLPIYPILQKILSYKIKKFNPDLIIISSFAIAKNISINWIPKILYLHSPMQYIWSHYNEYINNNYFKNSKIKKFIFSISSKYLRKWDKKFVNFDKIYFNSNYTKKTFEQIYKITKNNWIILYPLVTKPNYKKIDVFNFYKLPSKYYIYIWRTVKFVKKLDKIINYFNKSWEYLVIVWDWPDLNELKLNAKSNIKFVWYISDQSPYYWNLLENAQAIVNLTKESFWIVNYHAKLLNIPIITCPKWAIKEIKCKKIYIDICD